MSPPLPPCPWGCPPQPPRAPPPAPRPPDHPRPSSPLPGAAGAPPAARRWGSARPPRRSLVIFILFDGIHRLAPAVLLRCASTPRPGGGPGAAGGAARERTLRPGAGSGPRSALAPSPWSRPCCGTGQPLSWLRGPAAAQRRWVHPALGVGPAAKEGSVLRSPSAAVAGPPVPPEAAAGAPSPCCPRSSSEQCPCPSWAQPSLPAVPSSSRCAPTAPCVLLDAASLTLLPLPRRSGAVNQGHAGEVFWQPVALGHPAAPGAVGAGSASPPAARAGGQDASRARARQQQHVPAAVTCLSLPAERPRAPPWPCSLQLPAARPIGATSGVASLGLGVLQGARGQQPGGPRPHAWPGCQPRPPPACPQHRAGQRLPPRGSCGVSPGLVSGLEGRSGDVQPQAAAPCLAPVLPWG